MKVLFVLSALVVVAFADIAAHIPSGVPPQVGLSKPLDTHVGDELPLDKTVAKRDIAYIPSFFRGAAPYAYNPVYAEYLKGYPYYYHDSYYRTFPYYYV